MDISTLFILIGIIMLCIVFFPDAFPFCSCCKRIKPRPFFRIHKTVNIRFGYSANISICKKCSTRYNISSLSEYKQLEKVRKKIHIKLNSDL